MAQRQGDSVTPTSTEAAAAAAAAAGEEVSSAG